MLECELIVRVSKENRLYRFSFKFGRGGVYHKHCGAENGEIRSRGLQKAPVSGLLLWYHGFHM